jgi:hypothetical protein
LVVRKGNRLMERKLIQEGEVRPWFVSIGVPDGSDIVSANAYAYDITDGTKTLINGFADCGALVNGVRLVCSGATYGKTYRVLIEALLDTGQTRAKAILIECRKQSEKVRSTRPSTLDAYMVDFSSDLPAGAVMNATDTTVTAYNVTDLATDIGSTIVQDVTLDPTNDLRLRIDTDNLAAWDEVLVSVLGFAVIDTVTNTVYKIRRTILIPCVED